MHTHIQTCRTIHLYPKPLPGLATRGAFLLEQSDLSWFAKPLDFGNPPAPSLSQSSFPLSSAHTYISSPGLTPRLLRCTFAMVPKPHNPVSVCLQPLNITCTSLKGFDLT